MAPARSPSIIIGPDSESALVALKKPPMLHPKESVAPIPMRHPPTTPLSSSHGGAPRTWNWRPSSAAANAPPMIPRLSTEVE